MSDLACIELEITKERRKLREVIKEEPGVAAGFLRLRAAEERENRARELQRAEAKERKRKLDEINAQRDAALAELKRAKRAVRERESVLATRHAFKTFTLEVLGAGRKDAGGATGRKRRHEVLDRLAQLKVGLSPGQRNDWLWFKEAWDEKMVAEHQADWASVFSGWMQAVLNDTRSNAFSIFVHNETARVLSGTMALCVPWS